MAGPTVVSAYALGTYSGTWPRTQALTWLAGDLVWVIMSIEWDANNAATPTLAGVTFDTHIVADGALGGEATEAHIFTGIASSAGTSVDLTADLSVKDATYDWAVVAAGVTRDHNGVGTSGAANGYSQTDTFAANSQILVGIASWQNDTTLSAQSSPGTWTLLTSGGNADHGNAFAGYYGDSGTAGSKTVGGTETSWNQPRIAYLEVLKSTGTAPNEGSVTETLTISESAAGLRASLGAVTEQVTIGETTLGVRAPVGRLTEQLSLAETVDGSRLSVGSLVEQVTIAESVIGLMPTSIPTGTIVETLYVGETVAGGRLSIGSLSEQLTITEDAAGKRTPVGRLTEQLTISEVISGARTSVGRVTEQLTLAEAVAGSRLSLGSLVEQLTITEDVEGRTGIVHLLPNTGTIHETLVFFTKVSGIKVRYKRLRRRGWADPAEAMHHGRKKGVIDYYGR